jgi:hypothetical protein
MSADLIQLVLIDRENTTAFVMDIAVPLTHNLATEKITKHEQFVAESFECSLLALLASATGGS